jgi:glycosyltransferase involved in cell wall biosynthesis
MDNNPKKILIVSHHYPPHITGVGIIAHNQAKNLVRLGNDVTVVTSDVAENQKSGFVDGVKVVRVKALNFTEKFSAPFPIFSPSILYHLYKNVKNADVVHVHDSFYMSSFFAVIFAKIYKKPILLTQHVSLVAHPSGFVMILQKIVYSTTGYFIQKCSDLILTYNNRVESFLLNRGMPESKMLNLVNGVDTDYFTPANEGLKRQYKIQLGLNPDKKALLFVGRFVPKKGFKKVLDSQDDKYQIVFVGGDASEKSTDRTIFMGKVSQKDILKIYQACDVFILPSESEGFPVSIQEAMACGLPIITAKDDGYNTYNLDERYFEMILNPTRENIKSSIDKIVFDEDRIKKMSDYSLSYALANFSWINAVNTLNKVLTNLIEQRYYPKKIAFVSDAIYEFNKGGKEKRLYDVTRKLAQNGYDVTVYCMKWWAGKDTFEKEGVKYHAISAYYPLYHNERRSIKQAVIFALNCFKLINKDFDIMDVDHIPHLVLFTTKIVCVLRRKTMVVTWHEVWGKKYWKKYLGFCMGTVAYIIEKLSSKFPNRIVSVSDHTTNDLVNILNVKKTIFTVPNGIDYDFIQKSMESVEKSDIIFAGRLLANKNVDVLLHAIEILKKKGITLKTFIIGDGPEMDNLKNISKKLGLNNEVKFFGFLPQHTDVYGLMKSSKIFVLPSTREGFGIVVIEANAAGLPVITINNEQNAAKDLIIDNKNGRVCLLDAELLAESIKTQLNSVQDKKFYIKYSEKYDWNKIFSIIQKVYN